MRPLRPARNVIPDRLLESLAQAPRSRWLALDVLEMRVLDCSDDLVVAIQKLKDVGLLTPLIWCPRHGFPGLNNGHKNE